MTRNDNLNSRFIQEITKLSESDFNDIFIDSGCKLLDNLIPNDSKAKQALTTDPYYWNWYHKSFCQRNHLFIQYLETELADFYGIDVSEQLRERFEFAHSVEGIRSYQKRVPFYIIDVMYKRFLYENKEEDSTSAVERRRIVPAVTRC